MPVVNYLRRNSSSLSQERSLESLDNMNLHSMMSKTIQFDELLNEDENYMHQRKHALNDDDDNDRFEIHFANPNTMKGLEKLNEFYIKPLLIRKPSFKSNDEHEIRQHDRKPLLSSSNGGKKSSLIANEDEDDDEDGEDDLLVVNQFRQENFQLKTIKETKRTNIISHDT
jgi:hypothetical protein